jgi:hypothetical protein
MELTGILTFIGVFIVIISILIGIAYYGIKEASYEDTVRGKQLANGKPEATATKLKKVVKAKAKKEQDSDKTKAKSKSSSSANTQNEQSTEEEEPIVLIPDPFTNKVNSRFGSLISANNLKYEQKKQPTANAVTPKVQTNVVQKPKPVAKPVQETLVNNVSAQRQKENAPETKQPLIKTVPLAAKVNFLFYFADFYILIESFSYYVYYNINIFLKANSLLLNDVTNTKNVNHVTAVQAPVTVPQFNESSMEATRLLQKKINDLNHSLTDKSSEIEQLKALKTNLRSEITK